MLVTIQFFGDMTPCQLVECVWNLMAQGDARAGKWRGHWRKDWVANTLHITSQHGVSSITTADAHTSAAISRLNWLPHRFKWTRPFRRKTKSGFCACDITFQTQSIWLQILCVGNTSCLHFQGLGNLLVESSWNVMAHGDAREGIWRGNWRMEWVANTLHTTSKNGVSNITTITTADAHTSAASSRLNWRHCRFKWTRPFRRKTKSGFCTCAITFQTQSNYQ